MATTQGKWTIKNLKHNQQGISIPVRLYYRGANPVDVNITTTALNKETNWYTDIVDGQGVRIQPSDITYSGGTVTCGDTVYQVTDPSTWNWTILPVTGSSSSSLTIRYTGSQVSALSGTTSAFSITAQNATVTGYTVNNGASITASGASSVTVSYPANQNETQPKTYTVTVKGKDSNNNLVSGSTTFTQSADNNYTFALSPASTTAEATQVSKSFTVTATNITNVGYASSLSVGLTGGTANSTAATAKFSQNESTSPSDKTFVITGKTETGRVVEASATIRQSGVATEYYVRLSNASDQNAFENVPCTGYGTRTINLSVNLPNNVEWHANSGSASWVNITENQQTSSVVVSFADYNGSTDPRETDITIGDSSLQYEHVTLHVKQYPCETPPPQPEYSLVVSIAEGYSSTIDSSGTTKLVATYYDGLGGSTAVTADAEWLITSGTNYINLTTTTDPVTVTGRGNQTEHDQISKVMARFGDLSSEISITVLKDPVVPPFIELSDPSDLNHFQNVPCTGLGSYDVGVTGNVAWKARLSDIDDYWVHISYDTLKVTVYIDQNTDPYSGEGGDPRTSSFIIEAVDSSLGVSSITINISQQACDDLINIPNRDPFVFTCDGPSSYTRTIEAWDDVQWHIVPVFGEYQEEEWFSVSPTSGYGDGSFTVTILTDNYDNLTRGSGYLQIYTGSTQTYLDWDINVRQEPTPFFDVDGNSIHAASEGGNVSIKVYTNKSITATTTNNWIKDLNVGNNVRVVGGTAYTMVTFTIEENQSVDQREGNVSISSTYDGVCGPLGSENVQILQDGAQTDSATFIKVKKENDPNTAWGQSIEYPISEADASTTAVTFNIWSDGKCKVTSITSSTGHEGLRVVMVNGGVELDVTDGTPFDGTATFKAIYGQAYIGHEKNFKITFEVKDPGLIVTSDERATVEITQERDYPVGVTGVTIENVGPSVLPNTSGGPGSTCNWHTTEMRVQIYAETVYKSGYRTHSSEAIDNYIKWEGNNSGVDDDILTLTVTNNPSTGWKYCYTGDDDLALADELHGGSYHATYDYPFKIQFSPNTGTTITSDPWADGFRRDVNFHLEYNDIDGNHAESDFTVRVPYCNPPEPETQEVYIYSGGSMVDEVTINPAVDANVEILLCGLTIGETVLTFDCDESLTQSIIDNFEIQYEFFDVYDPLNSWTTHDTTSPLISFTRKTSDEFRFDIICNRPGYEEKILHVYFDEWS